MVFRLPLHITGEFDYARFVLVPTRTETHSLSLSAARVSAAPSIAVALEVRSPFSRLRHLLSASDGKKEGVRVVECVPNLVAVYEVFSYQWR